MASTYFSRIFLPKRSLLVKTKLRLFSRMNMTTIQCERSVNRFGENSDKLFNDLCIKLSQTLPQKYSILPRGGRGDSHSSTARVPYNKNKCLNFKPRVKLNARITSAKHEWWEHSNESRVMHTTNAARVRSMSAKLVVCITSDECNFTSGLKFRHEFLFYGTSAVEEWLSPRPPSGRIVLSHFSRESQAS